MLKALVHALPAEVAPKSLDGALVLVVDVLRATTSMVWGMQAGASRILPVAHVEEARRLAQAGNHLLGGERHGLRIEGFDLGNAPAEYAKPQVKGRVIVMSTTNGTQALLHCQLASRVLVAAFANLTALAREIVAAGQDFHVLCAGTDGVETREDMLFAGALLEAVGRNIPVHFENETGQRALEMWRAADPAALASELEDSQGGRNLLAIGKRADVHDAAIVDRCQVLPEFTSEKGIVVMP